MAEHKTHSLPGAAYAITNGAKILRCDRVEDRRCSFIFGEPVAALVQEFFKGAEVPGNRFYDALLELRQMVNRTLDGGAR